jgi:RNA polymerase sigma-70 factor (ECF subfamily)
MKNQVEMPDEKLIQFYLNNNHEAITTLTSLYKDRIYSTIYDTVKDKYAAEIIFRDVFMKIMNTLIAGKNPENTTFLQWATQVARQLCLEYNYKSELPAVCNDDCDGTSPINQPEFLPAKTYYDSHTRIRAMIHKLPDEQRQVMIMSHYAGNSFRDIATKMKCSVTSALDIMKYALTNLQKLMTEEGLALS